MIQALQESVWVEIWGIGQDSPTRKSEASVFYSSSPFLRNSKGIRRSSGRDEQQLSNARRRHRNSV